MHHLLYNQVAYRFHRRFIADSCACIPGRGTLYAAQRLEAIRPQLTACDGMAAQPLDRRAMLDRRSAPRLLPLPDRGLGHAQAVCQGFF